MKRQTINEIKLCLIGAGLGAAVFGSFLFFGCRAKAASVRDGVHSPVFAELQTIDRQELNDMKAREEYVLAVEDEAPVASVGYSGSDLDLLAALVWAEAGDQDFIGKRIVADCVLNRVRSGAWPGSVEAVIYQPGQFSVVANGRLSQGFYNADAECYEAARLALSGDHYDTQVIYFSMYYCANGAFAYQHGDHFIGY